MHIVSTNFAKALVWKHEYDVKLWRHKQRTPNTNDHHKTLNNPSTMKIFCIRHWTEQCFVTLGWLRYCYGSQVSIYSSGSQRMGRKWSKNGSCRGDLNLGCTFSPLPLLVSVSIAQVLEKRVDCWQWKPT